MDILLYEKIFTIFATPKRNQALRKVNPLSTYKTISANKATATKCWYVVDADGQTLGRMSSQLALSIRGKN